MQPNDGDLLVATRDIAAKGIAGTNSKSQVNFHCTIPSGMVLRCEGAPAPGASSFWAVPKDRITYEKRLVPDDVRQQPEYGNAYWILVPLNVVGTDLKFVSRMGPPIP